MAYTTIDDPSAHFQTTLYTGSGSAQDITNDGNSDLQPDMVWIKARTTTNGVPHLSDSSRGVSSSSGKYLRTDATSAEGDDANGIRAFNSDGFKTGDGWFNGASSYTYVAWQWKANGGTTSSNTDGDLTSTVQFNSTAKFSIVLYTGKNPIEPLDIGHGMGEVPDVFWIKNRDRAANWGVYHKELTSPAENRNLKLNLTNAEAAESTFWRNEAPTTSIIKTGENASVNVANEDFVVYAWKEVQGYSKFGQYTGTGNGNGPFVYTGFKPAFIMVKDTAAAGNWFILDHKRTPTNLMAYWLIANGSGAETNYVSAFQIDNLSNGFKLRTSYSETNTSGRKYIYMAFAENPFVTSTGVPCTAR